MLIGRQAERWLPGSSGLLVCRSMQAARPSLLPGQQGSRHKNKRTHKCKRTSGAAALLKQRPGLGLGRQLRGKVGEPGNRVRRCEQCNGSAEGPMHVHGSGTGWHAWQRRRAQDCSPSPPRLFAHMTCPGTA